MLFFRIFLIVLFTQALAAPHVRAQDTVATPSAVITSGLPVPRFVSLKSDQVMARTGPSLRYPARWFYQQAGLPVEVIQEFDTWRKIRDIEGEEGWVSQGLISGERTVLVKGEDLLPMREGFSANSRMLARLEPGVIARLHKCTEGWCEVTAGGFKGWAQRNMLWGIYENEVLN